MRELGFDGFRYFSGDYAGTVSAQKSRHNTKDTVDFTIHLGASYIPTGATYWHTRLPRLIPGRHRGWWRLQTGQPTGPVAQDVLAAFHAYGWPAILAALDSPGYPPDPAARRERTPRPEPSTLATQDGPPLSKPPQPAEDSDPRIKQLFTDISARNAGTRFAATETIVEFASEDPRTVPTLLTLLDSDPDEEIRQLAARALAPRAGSGQVREALEAAAAEDETLYVRWAARYALRLATPNHNNTT